MKGRVVLGGTFLTLISEEASSVANGGDYGKTEHGTTITTYKKGNRNYKRPFWLDGKVPKICSGGNHSFHQAHPAFLNTKPSPPLSGQEGFAITHHVRSLPIFYVAACYAFELKSQLLL